MTAGAGEDYHERNTYFIPTPAGQPVPDQLCQLVSRRLAIKGVTVDNANGSVPVLIYRGTSASGTPYPVLPGKSLSIGMDGPYGAYLVFDGIPSKDGIVYVSVSARANELFNASSVSVEGSVKIDSSTPVAVSVTGALPISTPVYPPPGATLVDYNVRLSLTSATTFPIQVDPGPGTGAGLALYTLFARVNGFDRQPYLHWRFSCRADAGNYNLVYGGYGDDQVVLPATYLFRTPPQAAQGVFFEVVNAPAIVGVLDCFAAYSGYYL